MSHQELTKFTIKENRDGSYRLSSSIHIENTYLSQRSTKHNYFKISEPFYASVTNVKGIFRNKSIKKKNHFIENVEFEDVFISDYKIHTIFVADKIRKGESVSYDYSQDFTDIAFLPVITVPNVDQLPIFQVTFKHPKNFTVDFEFFFPRDSILYMINDTNKKQTVLTFKNLKKRKPIKYSPFSDYHAAVLTTIKKNGQPINPTSAAAFTDWYGKQVNLKFSPEDTLGSFLPEKINKGASKQEKIKAIHDFVRKNIRYIADERSHHAYIPRSPLFTLEKSYGDCKDRAFLVSALAAKHNIVVNLVLLSTEPRPPFSGIHIWQYNHVICMTKDQNGKAIFFDPTRKYCEFGNLPEKDVEAKALVLDPQNPRLMVIPAPNKLPSIDVTVIESLENSTPGIAKIVLRNDYFSSALRAKQNLYGVNLENFLSHLINTNFYKFSFENFKLSEEQENSITFTAMVDISNFIISSTSQKYIPKNPFLTVNNDILERKDDPYPLYLPYRQYLKLAIDLDITGFEATDEYFVLGENDTNSFLAKITKGNTNRIQLDFEFRQLTKYFEGTAKNNYLDFCTKYFKSKKQMFVLKRSEL